jgi:hypothetical protein
MEKFELPLVLNVTDVKNILGIGQRQAYELANSGKFHTVRINRRIKIPRESFLSWLQGKES